MAKIQTKYAPELAPYLLEPETIQAIDEGFRSAIRQGFTPTVVQQAKEMHSDWFPDALACRVPITIIHGKNDKNNSIESIQRFSKAVGKTASLVEVENAGDFLHLTHEDLFVAHLKKLAEC
jgi:pimeloyl-ACP methyl ester carboxylesterase